jgi:hypothetical protein
LRIANSYQKATPYATTFFLSKTAEALKKKSFSHTPKEGGMNLDPSIQIPHKHWQEY